jgi:hypothetical protein
MFSRTISPIHRRDVSVPIKLGLLDFLLIKGLGLELKRTFSGFEWVLFGYETIEFGKL